MVSKDDLGLFSHYFWLVSSKISLAFSGLLFWFVAARIYSVEDIGLASVLISVSGLLVFISSLGIAPTLVRFLPEDEDKEKLAGTLFSFSLSLLVFLYVIFLAGLELFLPKLTFLRTSPYFLFFLALVVSMQVFQTLESVFVAFEATSLVLLKSVIQNFLRIGLLFLVVSLGGFGIFSSNCLSAIVAILISVIYFTKRYPKIRFKLGINFSILKKLLPFSLINFLNAVSLNLPGMIFPLIIISLFFEREAGLFYIPWMIFMVYCSLVTSVNSVFLMKASYGEDVKKLVKKVFSFSLCLGMIGFLTFTLAGNKILLIFRKDFSQNSFVILKILFCSIFFFIVNQIFITISNIRKEILNVGIIAILRIFGIIIFSIIFLPTMKTEGIALAWLISNFIGSIYVFIIFFLGRKGIFKIS